MMPTISRSYSGNKEDAPPRYVEFTDPELETFMLDVDMIVEQILGHARKVEAYRGEDTYFVHFVSNIHLYAAHKVSYPRLYNVGHIRAAVQLSLIRACTGNEVVVGIKNHKGRCDFFEGTAVQDGHYRLRIIEESKVFRPRNIQSAQLLA